MCRDQGAREGRGVRARDEDSGTQVQEHVERRAYRWQLVARAVSVCGQVSLTLDGHYIGTSVSLGYLNSKWY